MSFVLTCPFCQAVVAEVKTLERNPGVFENQPVLLEAGCPDKTHLGCAKARFERKDS